MSPAPWMGGPPMSLGPRAGAGVPRGQQVPGALLGRAVPHGGEWPWPALSALSLRGKSCRTITFEQFKEALEELSKKRFRDKSSEEAVREVHRLIEGKAPIISGVTVSMAGRDSLGEHSPRGLGPDGRGVHPQGWADAAAHGLGPWGSHGRTPLSPLAESHLVAHRISAHGHDQVHGLPQGTLRPIRPGQGEGRPCGPGGRVGLRARLQTRRHLRPEGAGGQVASPAEAVPAHTSLHSCAPRSELKTLGPGWLWGRHPGLLLPRGQRASL